MSLAVKPLLPPGRARLVDELSRRHFTMLCLPTARIADAVPAARPLHLIDFGRQFKTTNCKRCDPDEVPPLSGQPNPLDMDVPVIGLALVDHY